MRARLPRITYGNVVSTLALFIALGGVSYAAATLPKNSVGSAQLKKNAVTTKKIKDKSITGSDIKNSTLSGKQIKVGSLGTVPSATSAGSADVWTKAITPTIAKVGPSADNASSSVALAQATEVPLASNGSISVYGKCYTSGGGLLFGIYYKTSQNGALANVSAGPSYYGSPYLDTTTPESSRFIYTSGAGSPGTGYMSSSYYGVATLLGPDGKGLNLRVNMWAKNGTPPAGNGPFGTGNVCLFSVAGEKLDLG